MTVFQYLIAPATTDPRAYAMLYDSVEPRAPGSEEVPLPVSLRFDSWPAVRASCRRWSKDRLVIDLQVPNGSWGAADSIFADLLARLNLASRRGPMELVRRLCHDTYCPRC